MQNKDEELLKLGTLIAEKYLLPEKHLGISSRQVNYWKTREILPFFEKEKKGFMDMQHALWLLIINELYQMTFGKNLFMKNMPIMCIIGLFLKIK